MIQKTQILLSAAAMTGTQVGITCSTQHGDTEYVVAQVSVKSGTGTGIVEGRNTPGDDWVLLWQSSTTDSSAVLRHPQMRARFTGATALTALVTLDEPVWPAG